MATVVREDLPEDAQCIVVPSNLARVANQHRQKHRPAEPDNFDFDLELPHVPEGFLQQDITLEGARHLIFATTKQVELRRSVEQVFMDGTFKVVKKPFAQLFSFHGFLKDDDGQTVKQVPLVYVLMSRRRKRDYVAVFKAIRNLAPNLNDVDMVTDFESAIWGAARKVFPGAVVHGCSFHWAQAVWRHIQELGLVRAFRSSPDVRKYIKVLLALPLVPADEIEVAFNLHASMATDQLKPLVEYINQTWINGKWKPEDWSVFKRAIRTNNDVEGWHYRLNRQAQRANLPMYMLIKLLHTEARLIPYQLRLVSQNQLRRFQRRKTKETRGILAQLWKDFEKNGLSIMQLLRKASELTLQLCPTPSAAHVSVTPVEQ